MKNKKGSGNAIIIIFFKCSDDKCPGCIKRCHTMFNPLLHFQLMFAFLFAPKPQKILAECFAVVKG